MSNNVYLNIYDLDKKVTTHLNKLAKPLGAGAYHCGVEVYGREWSFGYTDSVDCGIFWYTPRQHTFHKYRKSVHMGTTSLTPVQLFKLIDCTSTSWMGNDYNLFSRNCINFSEWLLVQLGIDQSVPSYIRAAPQGMAAVSKTLGKIAKLLTGSKDALTDDPPSPNVKASAFEAQRLDKARQREMWRAKQAAAQKKKQEEEEAKRKAELQKQAAAAAPRPRIPTALPLPLPCDDEGVSSPCLSMVHFERPMPLPRHASFGMRDTDEAPSNASNVIKQLPPSSPIVSPRFRGGVSQPSSGTASGKSGSKLRSLHSSSDDAPLAMINHNKDGSPSPVPPSSAEFAATSAPVRVEGRVSKREVVSVPVERKRTMSIVNGVLVEIAH